MLSIVWITSRNLSTPLTPAQGRAANANCLSSRHECIEILAQLPQAAKGTVQITSLLLGKSARLPFADSPDDLGYPIRVAQHRLRHPHCIVSYVSTPLKVIEPRGIAVFHAPNPCCQRNRQSIG